MVHCDEYFPIDSQECNLHPYTGNKEGLNEVFRKLKNEHEVAYGALITSELLEEPRRELTQHERAVEEDALRAADLEEELKQNGVVDSALRFAQEKQAKKIRDKTNTQIRKSLKASLTAIETIRAHGPLSHDLQTMKKILDDAFEREDLEDGNVVVNDDAGQLQAEAVRRFHAVNAEARKLEQRSRRDEQKKKAAASHLKSKGKARADDDEGFQLTAGKPASKRYQLSRGGRNGDSSANL